MLKLFYGCGIGVKDGQIHAASMVGIYFNAEEASEEFIERAKQDFQECDSYQAIIGYTEMEPLREITEKAIAFNEAYGVKIK